MTSLPDSRASPARDDPLQRAPRSLPPRLVDVAVMLVVGVVWAAHVAGNVETFDDPAASGDFTWDARRIAMTACAPAILALWWRRKHPVRVLAVALAATLVAFPAAGILGIAALYAAVIRLTARQALLAGVVSTGFEFAGYALWLGAPSWTDTIFIVAATTIVVAIGLYIGTRRAYLERLRERALFARALASFLPAGVAELVAASPSALSLQEELEATVLFSDIRGFSTVAEQLAPREVAEIVGRHASAMAEVVLAHGGMLDKFAGDAVMAVFGAPKPASDDADRAISCATAMQRRQAELNDEKLAHGLPSTEIGIGLNTGTVIAGTLGGGGRFEYTVLGDAVNVAQRLQSEAEAGEILASAQTIQAAAAPAAEPAGLRTLKGRREPVDVYRVPWADDRGPGLTAGAVRI